MRHFPYFIVILVFCLSTKRITAQDVQYLPAVFHNNLIQIFAKISEKDTLWFYTDTGGMNFIYKSGIKKLGASHRGDNLWKKLKFDSIFQENIIPSPGEKTIQYLSERKENSDGMLGREWFSGGRWLIDYQNHQLGTIQSAAISPVENFWQRVPMYFRKENAIISPRALPRIEVVIDSDTLSFLLDTPERKVI